MARPERTDQVLVLGIDPGTAVTGYGVVARRGDGAVSLVECGVIRTSRTYTSGSGGGTVHPGATVNVNSVR